MSGIAGIFHLSGRPVDPTQLESMTDAIAHRGPHGQGHWVDGPIGLGHVLLRTVPEARFESQPLNSEDERFVVVLDGRIDNREELVEALDLPRRMLREPDVVLVGEAYRKWGTSIAKHLLGDFALAIWDREARQLFLARDHFGIRPLFYVHEPGRLFAFASEVKALRAAGLASNRLDSLKIAQFLLLPVDVDPVSTYYSEVSNLLPAHQLVIGRDATEVRQEQYWALDPTKEARLGSDDEYIARFRELFDQAVRCRLRSATPVGAMMSGGLDSTAIACVASRQLAEKGEPVRTYSAVFDNIPEANERKWIESTLQQYGDGMQPTFFAADQTSPLSSSETLTWYMDRANEGINSYIPFELYRRAGEDGVLVMLDGFDGDTTVSHGDAYYLELLWSWRWLELLRDIRASVEVNGGSRKDWLRVYRGWIKFYLRHQPLLQGFLTLWRRRSGTEEAGQDDALRIKNEGGAWRGTSWRKILSSAFARHIDPFVQPPDAETMWTRERDHHYMNLTRPLMESALRSFDAKAAAAGIEARYPFYDVRLVEYCLSLPGRFKRREGFSRWIMRTAMEGILPKDVQWRLGKPDLVSSYIAGLWNYDRERIAAFGREIGPESPIAEYLDVKTIADLANRFAAGELSDRSHEDERVLLWRAMALEQWLSNDVCKPEIEPQAVDSM
ncbi:MAG TPA: lasso peptide isopeptide bond-forming cyclase [Rhodothermales bacterium]